MSSVEADSLIFAVYWTEHRVTAGEYIEQLLEYLSALKSLMPCFQSPSLVTKAGEFAEVSITAEAFTPLLLPELQKDDTWYRRRDGAKQTTVTLDSYCSTGFYTSFVYDCGDTAIELSVYGGNSARTSKEDWQMEHPAPNSVVIDCPYERFSDPVLARRLFLETVQHWHPTIGWAGTRALRDAVQDEHLAPIGWFTYFQDAEVAKFLPPGVKWEQLITSGILTCTGTEVPSANNPVDVEKLIKIRDALKAHGKLNWRDST